MRNRAERPPSDRIRCEHKISASTPWLLFVHFMATRSRTEAAIFFAGDYVVCRLKTRKDESDSRHVYDRARFRVRRSRAGSYHSLSWGYACSRKLMMTRSVRTRMSRFVWQFRRLDSLRWHILDIKFPKCHRRGDKSSASGSSFDEQPSSLLSLWIPASVDREIALGFARGYLALYWSVVLTDSSFRWN